MYISLCFLYHLPSATGFLLSFVLVALSLSLFSPPPPSPSLSPLVSSPDPLGRMRGGGAVAFNHRGPLVAIPPDNAC